MISVVLGIAVIGFLLYLLMKYVPMHPLFRNLITFVVVVCAIMWLVNFFGLSDYTFPRHFRW